MTEMTNETKEEVRHLELSRVLRMMAKEIGELKIRVETLEEKK